MGVLQHERVATGEPERWLYFLHGIFGSGRNWGSIARRVVRERPEWGALLVDLRQHGSSQGFPEPHTVHAAAADIVQLAAAAPPPDALVGHSFGGKVALLAAGLEPLRGRLRQVWLMDSTPEARAPEGGAWEMLQLLRSLPDAFQTRDQLVDALVRGGVARSVAQWMATNLRHVDNVYRWRFDLAAIEDLLLSFFATEAWDIVEHPPGGLTVHIVRATRSAVMDDAAVARARAAAQRGAVQLHQVDAGHWLNADDPDTLVRLLVENL